MASRAIPPASPIQSCIHISLCSKNKEPEDNSDDNQMEDGSADPDDGDAPSGRGGRDSPDSPGAVHGHGPDFRTGSQGPLGALTIVQNRQILRDQLREIDELMGFMDEDGGRSDAAEGQEWAELHAEVDRLVKDKEEMHDYVKEANGKVRLRLVELRKWMARFKEIADLDSHELLLIRDKLPANLGPALARLITFSYHDDDSIEKMPKRYRDLMGKDLRLLAQQAVPLAPSQDVSALRRDLQSTNEELESARAEIRSTKADMGHLVFDKEKAVVAAEKLRAQMNDMSMKHRKVADVLTGRAEECSRSATKYANRCARLKDDVERQQRMLVDAEEERQRLDGQVADALQEVKLRDDKIKQLGERISLLAAAEEGSDSAFDTLKRTVDRLNEQNDLNQSMNDRLIEKMRSKNRSEQDRQQRRITQLEEQAERLQRENNEIRVLRQDKAHLDREVKQLTTKVTGLEEKQDSLTRQSNGVWEEKLDLEKKKEELEIRAQEAESRLEELNNSYKDLQVNEASYLEEIQRLNTTIKDKDLAHDIVAQRLASTANSWETRCKELQRQNATLGQEVRLNEEAIGKVQKLVQCETKLRADIARLKKNVDDLTKDAEGLRAKLIAAEDENGSLRERLGTCAAESQALRADVEREKALVGNLTQERHKDRERICALEGKLGETESEKNVKSGAVTWLEKQVENRDVEIKRLVADVARLGTTEEERKRLLSKEQEEVRRLRESNSGIQESLENERQNGARLARKRDELQEAIRAQRLEADEVQGLLRKSIEEEKVRSEQLERKEAELGGSVEAMRAKQALDAENIRALEQSVQEERSERESSHGREKDTQQRLESLQGQYQVQLEETQAHLDQARAALADKVESHERETQRADAAIKQLEKRLSTAEGSLTRATSRAQESLEGLQGFLSRLCLGPTGETGAFEGLARQLQTACTVESQEKPCESAWVILETWGDESEEDRARLPDGLEMLMLELFRYAVVGRIDTRECHQTLQEAVKVVSAGTAIHPGVLGETAKAFVRAVAERPGESFQAAMVFWQLLTVVDQRWGHADLRVVKDDLAGTLSTHAHSSIFRLVAGREELRESEECHFFSDALAVVARAAAPCAALVDGESRSVRFFAKTRWTAGIWGFTIKPPGERQELFLQSRSIRDVEWAKVMEAA